MEKVLIVRYRADCGRLFSKKATAILHDKNCRCFKNPKFRACHTCDHSGGLKSDEGGSWRECKVSDDFDYEKHQIPGTPFGDCVNCPMWKNNKYKGIFEKWEGVHFPKSEKENNQIKTDFLPF